MYGGQKSGQSIVGGVFILCNVTIGLGLLNMPYSFMLVGPTFILVMICIGGLSMYTALLIFRAIELTSTFHGPEENRDWGYLAEMAFGTHCRRFAEFTFRGELVAYILSFLCTVGVHVNMLFPTVSVAWGVMISCVAVFLTSYLPASFMSKICVFAHLAYAVSVACLVYSEYAAMQMPEAPRLSEVVGENWDRIGFVAAIPKIPTVLEICVYSWAGHSVVPTIANSMDNPSDVKPVIMISYPVAIGLAMSVGLIGFLVLGPNANQVFTENLGKQYWSHPEGEPLAHLSWMRNFAAVLVIIKLGATIPCLLQPLLSSTEDAFKYRSVKLLWRVGLIFGMGLGACIFADKVVIAVAFAGATFSNTLVFILPCTVYYGIKRRVSRVGLAETVLLATIVGVGAALAVYGVYDATVQLLER